MLRDLGSGNSNTRKTSTQSLCSPDLIFDAQRRIDARDFEIRVRSSEALIPQIVAKLRIVHSGDSQSSTFIAIIHLCFAGFAADIHARLFE
jgi:hypothetical protein